MSKPCEFCGEAYRLEVLELHLEERTFTMDACCEAAYTDALTWLHDGVPRAEFVEWFRLQTGLKVRQLVAVDLACRYLGFVLDYGLAIHPISQADAEAYVAAHHNHLPSPPHSTGWIWGYGAWNGADLVGVCMVGGTSGRWDPKVRPTIAEVHRVAISNDLHRGLAWNAVSKMLGDAAKEAKRRGYDRIITYTRADESGASLKASGWEEGELGRPRRRVDPRPGRATTEKVARRRWTRWLRPQEQAA